MSRSVENECTGNAETSSTFKVMEEKNRDMEREKGSILDMSNAFGRNKKKLTASVH